MSTTALARLPEQGPPDLLYLLFHGVGSTAEHMAPLAQRLSTDFSGDPRFDNPRAVQVRLLGFDHDALVALGVKVRDLYADGNQDGDRIRAVVDNAYVAELATAVTGSLGGKVGVAPRVYLKKLVTDVLDRVDQFPDYDPRRQYALTLTPGELTEVERSAASLSIAGAQSADDVPLDLP